MSSRNAGIKVIVIAVLVILTCAYILPIYVMVVNSLKTLPEVTRATYLAFPAVAQWQNYSSALFGSVIS